VCCSGLQCVAGVPLTDVLVCRSFQCLCVCCKCSVLQHVAECCRVLQSFAVRCSVSQCVDVCCSVFCSVFGFVLCCSDQQVEYKAAIFCTLDMCDMTHSYV